MLTLWKPRAPARTDNGHTTADPFAEIERLFFDDIAFPTLSLWSAPALTAAADVSETDDEVRVSLDLPGLDAKDIEVSVQDDVLHVRAERRAERQEKNETFLRTERTWGAIRRSFRLPSTVDATKCDARYENGVLTLSLPKREEAKPRVIQVKVK